MRPGRKVERCVRRAGLCGGRDRYDEGVGHDRLEMLFDAPWHFPYDLRVTAGAGLGVLPGYGNAGWRVLASLAYSPRAITPADTDGDGLADFEDDCVTQPEDLDGYMDFDGPPDPDSDLDGILDADDACPNDAETPNDYQDEDGCPDQSPLSIVADKILMVWPVEFVPDTATLTRQGYDALEKLAAFLIDHGELTAIRIDAYTDDKGSLRKLHRLTEHRAQVVADTLDELRVAYFRLFPKGFGATNPIAPNDTEEGRKLNNRVEFTILERTD